MKGESKAAFVERVQQKIAGELNIPILDFTLQAKKQMIREAQKQQRLSHWYLSRSRKD